MLWVWSCVEIIHCQLREDLPKMEKDLSWQYIPWRLEDSGTAKYCHLFTMKTARFGLDPQALERVRYLYNRNSGKQGCPWTYQPDNFHAQPIWRSMHIKVFKFNGWTASGKTSVPTAILPTVTDPDPGINRPGTWCTLTVSCWNHQLDPEQILYEHRKSTESIFFPGTVYKTMNAPSELSPYDNRMWLELFTLH